MLCPLKVVIHGSQGVVQGQTVVKPQSVIESLLKIHPMLGELLYVKVPQLQTAFLPKLLNIRHAPRIDGGFIASYPIKKLSKDTCESFLIGHRLLCDSRKACNMLLDFAVLRLHIALEFPDLPKILIQFHRSDFDDLIVQETSDLLEFPVHGIHFQIYDDMLHVILPLLCRGLLS